MKRSSKLRFSKRQKQYTKSTDNFYFTKQEDTDIEGCLIKTNCIESCHMNVSFPKCTKAECGIYKLLERHEWTYTKFEHRDKFPEYYGRRRYETIEERRSRQNSDGKNFNRHKYWEDRRHKQ